MSFSSAPVAALLLTTLFCTAWISPSASAQEEPALATDQPQFSAETIPLFRVERTGTLLVPVRGRKIRVLILNPEVVEVETVSETHILFRGLKIDSTIVHIFEDSVRRTIRMEVTELVSIQEEILFREQEFLREKLGVPQRTLKFRYRGTERHLERGEKLALTNQDERNRTRTHDLTARMGTPSGDFIGKIYLEQRRDFDLGKEVTQPRHLSAEMKKMDLGPLGLSDVVAGDKDLNLSEYTLNRRYRGFGVFPHRPEESAYLRDDRPRLNQKVEVSMFGGEERQGYFLDLPAGLQTRQPSSYFAGSKVAYGLWEEGHVYFTGLRQYGEDDGDIRSDHLLAAGLNKSWANDRVRLHGEAARNGQEGAYQVETSAWLTDWLSTRHEFWHVGKNYNTVTGPVSDEGQTGWKGRLTTNVLLMEAPTDVYTEAEIFKDRSAPNPVNPDELNTIYTLGGLMNLPGQTYLQSTLTYEDQSGSPLPYVSRRAEIELSREIFFGESWLQRLTPFIGYRRADYEKSNVPGYDATLNLYRTGLRATFPGGFWSGVTYSQAHLFEKNPQIGPPITKPEELMLEAGQNHFFKVIPATLNTSVRYENVNDTFGKTHQPFADRDQFSANGYFSWRFSKDREAFAELSINRQKPELSPGDRIVELFAQVGVHLLWDTGFTMTQKGRISGFVFQDLNGDGRRDEGEPGMPGIRVSLEGGPETRTAEDGSYRIKGVPEGRALIRADPEQVPKGYYFTTPNSEVKLVLPRKEQRVDFGISTEVEFRGIVFNDLNEDKIYQEGADRPVGRVRMALETGKGGVSSADGFYSIRKATPGEHTLSVDLTSIPDGYRTLVPIQQTYQTKEGDVVQRDLPLKAQRIVTGSVFLDGDNNGTRAPDEKGLPGITVRLDGQQAETGDDGAFRFTNVKPGRYQIRVEEQKLPVGHKLASLEALELDVTVEPFLREKFDVAVVPLTALPPKPRPKLAPIPRPVAPPKPFVPTVTQGEMPAEDFTRRFKAEPPPAAGQTVYLLPAAPDKVITLYVQDTLRRSVEKALALESAALPAGIRFEVRPIPASETELKRPGVILRDKMLEPRLPGTLPAVGLFFSEEPPRLAALALHALRGDPVASLPSVGRLVTAQDPEGKTYWAWYIE